MTALVPRFRKKTCSNTQDAPEKGRENEEVNCRKAPGLSQDGESDGPTPSGGPRTTEGRRSLLPKALQGLDPQLAAEGSENREPRTRQRAVLRKPKRSEFCTCWAAKPRNPRARWPSGRSLNTTCTHSGPRSHKCPRLQRQDRNSSKGSNANGNNFCRELFFFALFTVENLGHKE